MKPRVTENWTPDSSTINVHRPRDQRLIIEALISTAKLGNAGSQDLIRRRLPDYGISSEMNDRLIEEPVDLGFRPHETPIVVGALALHANEHFPNRLSKTIAMLRATSLIGELVTHSTYVYINNQKWSVDS